MRSALSAAYGAALMFACAAAPAAVTKHKLGPNINTDAREIGVAASPDGRFLYITREDEPLTEAEAAAVSARSQPRDTCSQLAALNKQLPGSIPPELLERCATTGISIPTVEPSVPRRRQTPQRIFVAGRGKDGEWELAVPLTLQSKAKQSTSIVTVLPDNNTLVVLGLFDDNRSDCVTGPGGGAKPAGRCAPYWLAQRRGTGWDRPRRLDVDFQTKAQRTTAALLPNLRAFLLDMQRDGGHGGRDLYVAMATGERQFDVPINLGANINTPANEAAPTLAADGQTLYFASDRAGGQGGYDLYVTRRLDETWQHWSPPRNLGPDINTPGHENSITLDASGKFAYLVASESSDNKSSKNNSREDVWEFALPVDQRPEPVAFVYGTVRDANGKPVGAGIVYDRLRDGQLAGRANADLQRGDYQIALPIGEHYGFRANARGYIAVADHIDLRTAKTDARYQRDLLLVPLEPGRTVKLNNLFFDVNAAELLPESKAELDRVVALMNENPRLRIRIEAHTDSVGSDAANRTLSAARAVAVSRYLGAAQVAANRVESRGIGEASPAETNDTEEGRALNRRVEFRVLSL
jgi:outer membrane protein OmpA-like peptidoglycan-associated protein